MATAHKPRTRLHRTLTLGSALLTLAIAIAVTFGVMSHVGASHKGGASAGPAGAATHGQKGKATCDLPGQVSCPNPGRQWSPVASTSPHDLLAAMRANPAYMSPLDAFSLPSNSTYSFDDPVLVLPATTGTQVDVESMPEYIVCVSINGVRQVTYGLTYDPAKKQLYINGIGMSLPNEPHYGKPFPWYGVTASVALSKLQSARHVNAAPGFQPQLVYFAPDPQIAIPGHTPPWAGGGTNSGVAIWRIKGADGRLYFVGIDANVYDAAQLPIEPGSTIVQV